MKIELKVLNKEFYRVDKLGGSYYDYPDYQTDGAAAIDLVCTEDVTIYPGETKMIPTGLAVWIGSDKHSTSFFNYAGLIIPRSGLGTKGLVLANLVGLIDEDYQGELIVSAWNRNTVTYSKMLDGACIINHNVTQLAAGDRFAQLMFVPVVRAQFNVVDEFSSSTNRGEGNFGSTGI